MKILNSAPYKVSGLEEAGARGLDLELLWWAELRAFAQEALALKRPNAH